MQSGKNKILIVDDVPPNIEILNSMLHDDYEIYFATNGQDALAIAAAVMPQLVLLDIMMPEMDGYEVCRSLKNDPSLQDIPIIFITAMDRVENETQGLELGAVDYITKPFNPAIVKLRVRNQLELKRQRDVLDAKSIQLHLANEALRQANVTLEEQKLQLENANRLLEKMAIEDALTGLANRRHFNEVLNAEIQRGHRHTDDLSLIMCDVDYFKRYNDHYGHMAGDQCLHVIGRLLPQVFKRSGELSARYGGEEFAVILPRTPAERARNLAEVLRLEVFGLGIEHRFSDVAHCITISVGVVSTANFEGRDMEWFIKAADAALYQSKERGRNRVTLYAHS
ncbi:diguanylate cyclase [Desulfoferrobacter suflitae]|uniref:diguanylate cyclase n=1 Tax=Desulfoferrobacter suflitae TaxID=2865782 RepID=UPI0021648B5B|nr:diguanylate cyclase [Desulfoferrobacter suflitae]MCK8603511.1 diguanylate cyclase [Desulfoferrobacter suflitae]